MGKSKFFSLPSDILKHPCMAEVFRRYGEKGYRIAITLICYASDNTCYLKWDDKYITHFVNTKLSDCNESLVISVAGLMARMELFDQKMMSSKHILTSIDIQTGYANSHKVAYSNLPEDIKLLNIPPVKTAEKKSKPTKSATPIPQSVKQNEIKRETELFAMLKDSPIWQQQVSLKFKIMSEEDFMRLVDDFKNECECRGNTHCTEREIKNHFVNFLNKKKEYENRKTTNTEHCGSSARSAVNNRRPAEVPQSTVYTSEI